LEYRYALTQDTKGQANFYFTDDQVLNKNRYAFFVQHEQKFFNDLYLKGNINRVSDHDYLRDFDEDLPKGAKIDSRSRRELRSDLFGGKNWDKFSFLMDGSVYDDLTKENNKETVQKLPQISFYAHPQSLFKTPFFYDFVSSYTHFWRERDVEAHRGDLLPRISYPVRLFNVLKLESDVALRETLYRPYDDPTNRFQGWKSRETLQAAAEISTEFYRVYDGTAISKISDLYKVAKWMHTLEPNVSYTYIPPVDQSRLPAFDEVDQIPYTNQITYGVTQRLLGRSEKEGVTSGPLEYGKLNIFQSYSLGDPFIDAEGKKRSFSNIEADLWWNFGPYITARGNAAFNPYRLGFDELNFLINVKDRRNDAVQVQYRNTKDNVREINLDARVKTIPPLYLLGAFYYNLLAGTWVQSIFGVEYQAQCWSAGFIFENINQSPDGTQSRDRKYHFYFNLLNLGSVGHKPYFMSL
jgi:LPS-assembly protein